MQKLFATAVIAVAAGGFVWLAHAFYAASGIGEHPRLELENGFYFGRQARSLPPLSFQDTEGGHFDSRRFNDRWSFLFLGYTSCPDVCPPTVMQMQGMVDLARQQGIAPPQMVFVSVDPEYDTPQRIKRFLARFGRDVVGLSGKPQTLRELSAFLGAHTQKYAAGDGDAYLVDHSSKLFVVNPKAQLVAMLNPPLSGAGLTAQYRQLRDDHSFIARQH